MRLSGTMIRSSRDKCGPFTSGQGENEQTLRSRQSLIRSRRFDWWLRRRRFRRPREGLHARDHAGLRGSVRVQRRSELPGGWDRLVNLRLRRRRWERGDDRQRGHDGRRGEDRESGRERAGRGDRQRRHDVWERPATKTGDGGHDRAPRARPGLPGTTGTAGTTGLRARPGNAGTTGSAGTTGERGHDGLRRGRRASPERPARAEPAASSSTTWKPTHGMICRGNGRHGHWYTYNDKLAGHGADHRRPRHGADLCRRRCRQYTRNEHARDAHLTARSTAMARPRLFAERHRHGRARSRDVLATLCRLHWALSFYAKGAPSQIQVLIPQDEARWGTEYGGTCTASCLGGTTLLISLSPTTWTFYQIPFSQPS